MSPMVGVQTLLYFFALLNRLALSGRAEVGGDACARNLSWDAFSNGKGRSLVRWLIAHHPEAALPNSSLFRKHHGGYI